MRSAIVIVGYGNVGHHLFMALQVSTKMEIFVLSNRKNHQHLLNSESVHWIDKSNLPDTPPRFCFLTVRDDQIKKTAESLPENWKKESTIVHCSGVLPFDYLKQVCPHFALFYPLNSFSKEIPFEWRDVPVFIDSSREVDKSQLITLAEKFGAKAVENNDHTREQLHVAAVMVNNFSNHWFRIAAEFLKEKDIPFDHLLPLIRTTVSKLDYEPAAKAQTGPATRGDVNTLNKHLKMISNEEIRELYKKMSASINPSIKDKLT
ncbi:MAG: DUF2520 domain-containing protein [Saprospirales bacterium]|nr:MAG: DUF2520 domain-containing protein [Saprospirales bacterium]